jgi:hypothetical protein
VTMSKSGGRKEGEQEGAPAKSARAALSPDDADRAAAAFVPLWQFDEAPFAASPKVAEAEVRALASPRGTLIGMQLATAPVLSAPAPAPRAPIAAAVVPAPVAAPAPVIAPAPIVAAAAPAPDAVAEHELLMSRATIKMTPLHQPNVERPADPDLPSVIVDAGTPAAPPVEQAVASFRDEKTVPVRVVPPPPSDAPPMELRGPKTDPPTAPRGPKTDPPMARARPAPRHVVDPDELPVGYSLPRSRTPMLIGAGIAGSAVLILAVYAVSNAMSATPPATSTSSHADMPARTADPGPAIPPPSPADEAPVVAAPATPPGPAAAPPATPAANIPVATPAMLPPAPPIHTSTHAATQPPSPTPPPRSTSAPTHTAKPRNPTPAPAAGGIVRDNPF